MGRKQISELTFFDYVTGISIGTVAGTLSLDLGTNLAAGAITLAFWALFTLLSNLITLHNIPARKWINSEPLVVIRDGKILEPALKHRYYNINDLLMQLREHDVFDPFEVSLAIIETDGKLSVLKKEQPSKPKPIETGLKAAGKELIIDGCILEENLTALQLSNEWLYQELKRQNVTDISSVLLAMITPQGTLYISLKDQNTVLSSL